MFRVISGMKRLLILATLLGALLLPGIGFRAGAADMCEYAKVQVLWMWQSVSWCSPIKPTTVGCRWISAGEYVTGYNSGVWVHVCYPTQL